ncbi:MAG TPA: HD domain-containing protein [Candidatus Deferrimicrobium sp.]|nr:HD domain-containing protein [Candidatus Deferrimicrobium sp.]
MEYRQKVADFIKKAGKHPTWGINHCQRVYHMIPEIAGTYLFDEEIVYVSSMLHDVGSYPGYSLPNVDHALRSKGLASSLLNDWGYPQLKLPMVLDAIETHMFHSEPGKSTEAILLRDSDILDQLGNIGLVRLFSLVGLDEWASTPEDALERAVTFAEALPGKVQTRLAKRIAIKRREETLRFLNGLKRQTLNYKFI